MGRKATTRARKVPGPSAKVWLNELFSYWQVHGMAGQTMDDWAVAVEKSKATLYAYFSAKEEMVEAALALKLEDLKAFEEPLADTTKGYVERYRNGLAAISPLLSEISVRFLEDLQAEFPEQMRLVDQFLTYVGKILGAFYQEGMEAGAFRVVNTVVLVQMDQGFLQQLTDARFLKQAGISLMEAVEYFVTLKFDGLLK